MHRRKEEADPDALTRKCAATPDHRAIWESLTPAQRNDLGCVVANGGGTDDLPLATANPLAAAGLVEHVPCHAGDHRRSFRVGKAWWTRCNATDLGRAVAAAGKAGG